MVLDARRSDSREDSAGINDGSVCFETWRTPLAEVFTVPIFSRRDLARRGSFASRSPSSVSCRPAIVDENESSHNNARADDDEAMEKVLMIILFSIFLPSSKRAIKHNP
jgi:hypothetical protein